MSEQRRAILYSVLNQYSLQIISLVSIAVLARLLTPGEIGVFAVATSIAFLAIEIRAFGVSEFLVREKEVDRQKVMSVIGVMMIMSWGLALLLIAGAGWIAAFYGVADLRAVIWIVTVPFFFAPYSTVPVALLTREMRFDAILKIDLFGSLVRNLSSIGLVMLGFGYFGLAYGTLAGIVAEFLAITYFRPAGMPWAPSFKDLGHVLRVGMQISASKFLNLTAQSASDLVLGRLATMRDVGLYSRGLGLILFLHNLLIQAVGPVALPHLAQVKRSGGSVRDAYLNSIVLVEAFSLPLFAVVHLAAYSMITALFGDQWTAAVEIASILALWEILRSLHCFATPALLAIGKERLVLLKEVCSFTVKFALLILAVPYGLEYVAWGFVLSGAIDFVLVSVLMKHVLGLGFVRLFVAFVPNLLVAAACWLALKAMTLQIDFESMNSWLALLIIASAMVPVWLLGLRLTNNMAWPFVRGAIGRIAALHR
jgi:O-antigen/teichoic acid export membrane protein